MKGIHINPLHILSQKREKKKRESDETHNLLVGSNFHLDHLVRHMKWGFKYTISVGMWKSSPKRKPIRSLYLMNL
jgi:hypothetical protein